MWEGIPGKPCQELELSKMWPRDVGSAVVCCVFFAGTPLILYRILKYELYIAALGQLAPPLALMQEVWYVRGSTARRPFFHPSTNCNTTVQSGGDGTLVNQVVKT